MTLLTKNDLQLVELEEMNNVHFEELDIVNNIYDLILKQESGEDNNSDLLEALDGFVKHTEGHFANEERLMTEHMFPALHCHQAEHSSALSEIYSLVSNYKESGELEIIKRYFSTDLVTWLGNHIATMDTVTAGFIAAKG